MSQDRNSLAALSDQLADAVATASASIVAVHARPRLASTGVHWRDGIVMTTEGTIRREDGITVTLPDGATVPATLAGRDRGTDLAVLRIEPGKLPVAGKGDAATLKPGHLVLALARLDELGARAAFGAVSAVGGRWRCWKGGEIYRLVQSDIVIYPGFGGGPLVDTAGRIHGLNSGGLSRVLATTIPAATVDRVLDQLVERGYVSRDWLGAAMQPVRFNPAARKRLGLAAEGGLVIVAVEPEGPSAAAGLLVGDVIVSVNGRPVDDPSQVLEALAGDVVGKSLRLDLVRGGQKASADVLVGERPRERR